MKRRCPACLEELEFINVDYWCGNYHCKVHKNWIPFLREFDDKVTNPYEMHYYEVLGNYWCREKLAGILGYE